MTQVVQSTRRVIEWSECDPAGIVYYPRYSEMLDANTNGLFQTATGLTKRQLQAAHGIVGWPMVETQVSFASPATYGDEVVVESRIARFGTSSIEIAHRIAHADGRTIAEGRDKRVWAAPKEGGGIRAAPLPAAFTAAFGDIG